MQQGAQQGQVEGLIMDWCATNGFGSDPVTISTFTELAAKLLNALPDGLPQREDMPLMRWTFSWPMRISSRILPPTSPSRTTCFLGMSGVKVWEYKTHGTAKHPVRNQSSQPSDAVKN